MDRQKLWGILKILLKIGFTAGLIYLISLKINFNDVKRAFLKSDPFFIILAIILYFCAHLLSSWRSLNFLKSIGLELKFGFNLKLYMLGAIYNLLLPGGIGGDGYKIYVIRKKFKLPTKRIFWAFFLERFSGVWAIGFILVALIILIPQINIPRTWPLIAFLTVTIVYYIILKKYFSDYSKYFFKIHFISGMIQSLVLLSVICILLSQNFSGKFAPYLFSFQVSTLIAIVNVGVGGFGVREFIMAYAASEVFNIDSDRSVVLATTFWMISTLTALPGIWFLYNSKEFAPMPSQKEIMELDEKKDDQE